MLFSPLPGEMIQFDEHIFQMGCFNHQPGLQICPRIHFRTFLVRWRVPRNLNDGLVRVWLWLRDKSITLEKHVMAFCSCCISRSMQLEPAFKFHLLIVVDGFRHSGSLIYNRAMKETWLFWVYRGLYCPVI